MTNKTPKQRVEEAASGRRSGRTFRFLLRALQMASAGSSVVFFSPKYSMSRDAFKQAVRIAEPYSLLVEPNRLSICFDGGGSLRFVSQGSDTDKLRGLSFESVEDLG